MFTGLVQGIGKVERLVRTDDGVRWTISAPAIAAMVQRGDSINVAGACQTVTEVGHGTFGGVAIPETLRRTNYGAWHVGTEVNLEPAMRPQDRLGGHFVNGHVDATGTLRSRRIDSSGHVIDVAYPDEFGSWVVPKGSIAVDGVSLTIASDAPGLIRLALIPETLARTTLGSARIGDALNLEFDPLIKAVIGYVRRVFAERDGWGQPGAEGTSPAALFGRDGRL